MMPIKKIYVFFFVFIQIDGIQFEIFCKFELVYLSFRTISTTVMCFLCFSISIISFLLLCPSHFIALLLHLACERDRHTHTYTVRSMWKNNLLIHLFG